MVRMRPTSAIYGTATELDGLSPNSGGRIPGAVGGISSASHAFNVFSVPGKVFPATKYWDVYESEKRYVDLLEILLKSLDEEKRPEAILDFLFFEFENVLNVLPKKLGGFTKKIGLYRHYIEYNKRVFEFLLAAHKAVEKGESARKDLNQAITYAEDIARNDGWADKYMVIGKPTSHPAYRKIKASAQTSARLDWGDYTYTGDETIEEKNAIGAWLNFTMQKHSEDLESLCETAEVAIEDYIRLESYYKCLESLLKAYETKVAQLVEGKVLDRFVGQNERVNRMTETDVNSDDFALRRPLETANNAMAGPRELVYEWAKIGDLARTRSPRLFLKYGDRVKVIVPRK